MDDDAIMFKQKKRKVAIDSDQEDEEQTKSVTTKAHEEKPDRDNYEHKTNGDKPKEAKKPGDKKEEAKPARPDASPAKPKQPADKDKQNVKKDTDQKPAVKPKPAASGSGSEKKSGEANGQVQKKAPEEKKSSSKPPAKPTKKREESESGSEDSESESGSDSEDEKPKKKVSKPKPKASPKPKVTQKPKSKKDAGGPEKKVVGKDVLVYDVLKRWWYCVPEWPPVGFDYNAELAKQQLRKVDFKYWRIEAEVDPKGFKKVYEIPSYPGMFKNSKGEIIDLRPKDTCPSYDVFKKKSILELLELKVKALKNQIEALEKSVVVDEDLLKQLKRELLQAEKSHEKMVETQKNKK